VSTPEPPPARAPVVTPSPTHATRLATLERHCARLRPRLAALERASERLAWARLGVFGVGAAAATVAFVLGHVRWFEVLLVLMLAVFVALVRIHRRVDAAAACLSGWLAIQSEHVARARLDWAGMPAASPFPARAAHPFESDLDIVGERSLHRLLDVAVSVEGSARLRDWLTTEVPDAERIAARQRVIRELAARSRWRDRLALSARLSAEGDGRWRADRLLPWLETAPASPGRRRWLAVLGTLGLVNLVLFAQTALAGSTAASAWLRVSFPVYVMLYVLAARGLRDPFGEALALEAVLRRLLAVFAHLQRDAYGGAPALRALCRPFLDPADRPSAHLARVARVLTLAGLRSNMLLWPVLNAAGPFDLLVADRLDAARARLARVAPRWLDVWFEVEALGSLANLGWLNPEYAFPRLVADPSPGTPVFDARGLGHPLLPAESRVRNDIALQDPGELCIVTGSNMSGKSTFLKAVGVNLVLAQAGGPVDAAALSATLMRPFTCIRVTDSVTDGISYFYAEVRRLRALMDALEAVDAVPLCFLIDEIFRGTNNRERLIGSRAYVRALSRGRGVGLVATHDLELVALADEIPLVRNLHFRDDVTDGRMSFDYRLRSGPCPTTNALRIMRLEGLPE
jgi:hypothetical protein